MAFYEGDIPDEPIPFLREKRIEKPAIGKVDALWPWPFARVCPSRGAGAWLRAAEAHGRLHRSQGAWHLPRALRPDVQPVDAAEREQAESCASISQGPWFASFAHGSVFDLSCPLQLGRLLSIWQSAQSSLLHLCMP